MGVLSEVRAALEDVVAEPWRVSVALALAEAMDDSANASTAKELQSLMVDLTGAGVEKRQGDVSDDLASKRAARRAASS